jgi:hypothetical protein
MARRGTSGTDRPQEETTPAPSQVLAASQTAETRREKGNGPSGPVTEQKNQSERSQNNMSFTSDEIAQRAYQIYERDGRTDGRDMDHWLQAERELREERQRASAKPANQAANQQDRAASSDQAQNRGGSARTPQRPEEAPRSARRHQPSMV